MGNFSCNFCSESPTGNNNLSPCLELSTFQILALRGALWVEVMAEINQKMNLETWENLFLMSLMPSYSTMIFQIVAPCGAFWVRVVVWLTSEMNVATQETLNLICLGLRTQFLCVDPLWIHWKAEGTSKNNLIIMSSVNPKIVEIDYPVTFTWSTLSKGHNFINRPPTSLLWSHYAP